MFRVVVVVVLFLWPCLSLSIIYHFCNAILVCSKLFECHEIDKALLLLSVFFLWLYFESIFRLWFMLLIIILGILMVLKSVKSIIFFCNLMWQHRLRKMLEFILVIIPRCFWYFNRSSKKGGIKVGSLFLCWLWMEKNANFLLCFKCFMKLGTRWIDSNAMSSHHQLNNLKSSNNFNLVLQQRLILSRWTRWHEKFKS